MQNYYLHRSSLFCCATFLLFNSIVISYQKQSFYLLKALLLRGNCIEIKRLFHCKWPFVIYKIVFSFPYFSCRIAYSSAILFNIFCYNTSCPNKSIFLLLQLFLLKNTTDQYIHYHR